MQSVSSRIWTRVAVSISYDDNDYTIKRHCVDTELVGSPLNTFKIWLDFSREKGKMYFQIFSESLLL